MTIVKGSDKHYPYTIKGGWGDEVYCDFEDLLVLKKQIEKIEKKQSKSIDKPQK